MTDRIDQTVAQINRLIAERPPSRRMPMIDDVDAEITRINTMLGDRYERQGAQAIARLIAAEAKRRQEAAGR